MHVNLALSSTAEAISDILYGSVISPILVVICINDLPDHLSGDSLVHANETNPIAPRNHQDIFQSSLNVSASWAKGRETEINSIKAEHLFISKSPVVSLAPSRLITHPTPR